MTIVHTPNPCVPNVPRGEYRVTANKNVWYYRTEVHNNLTVPICVVQFNASRYENGKWVDGNIRGHVLGAQDFSDWYGGGIKVKGGEWIEPGGVAVCDPNWSAMDDNSGGKRRWWYVARDQAGHIYRADAQVTLLPVK